MEEFKDEIVEMVSEYADIGMALSELGQKFAILKAEEEVLKAKRSDLHERERKLINKIEEKTGQKVTVTELYNMLAEEREES